MLENSIRIKVKYLIAAGIGLVFGSFQRLFWAIYPIDNPINHWLIKTYAENGHSVLYYLAVYAHDLIVHLMLALILAFVLVKVFGIRRWKPVLVVVACSQIPVFWGAVWGNMGSVVAYWGFWVSLTIALSAIPAAYYFAGFLERSRSLN
ncbi:MAG: hypothetical protein AAGI27_11535 [Pseudomonadota bacterium]